MTVCKLVGSVGSGHFASGLSFLLVFKRLCVHCKKKKKSFCLCKLAVASGFASLRSRAVIICRDQRKEESLQRRTAKSFQEVKTPASPLLFPKLPSVGCTANPSCGLTDECSTRGAKTNLLAASMMTSILFFFWKRGRR